jgi:hypothetical protein
MAKKRVLKRSDFLHLGSLITYKEGDKECCLGSLIHFPEHGTFDPNFGKVDITSEEADAHNSALDQALIEGLDKNCKIGMGGFFYFTDTQVRTFTGLLVSEDMTRKGNTITFRRNGMTFSGKVSQDADCFDFERIE